MGKQFFTKIIGAAPDRVDGMDKVTGKALYAAEYKPDGLVVGVLITSNIARGRIKAMDVKRAETTPGVLLVLSHVNRPTVPGWQKGVESSSGRVEGQAFRPFYDAQIYTYHQPIALVVAVTLEQASSAAKLITVSYEVQPHQTNIEAALANTITPKRSTDYRRGNAATNASAIQITNRYTTPLQIHNPLEMHASTAHWLTADKLKVYSKTQASKLAQSEIAALFQLKPENVEVHSPFVGGAFGSSSRVWPQEMAALLAAKKLGRPVVVMAQREQVFNMVGYRPQSIQDFTIGASADGLFNLIEHHAWGSTSMYEEFTERVVDPTKTMYACPNLHTRYKLVQLDMSTPCWTRAPGEASGSFALESAVDELAYALKMDPLELRLKNVAETDPEKNIPWSSNYLKECYERGAKASGWHARKPAPRSMQQDGWLLGMGMSAGIYKAERAPATARATLNADGILLVQTSVADVGPGSATILTQIAADAFGLPLEQVRFEWGNSMLPPAPGQFGSHTTASTGSAVHDVTKALQQRLLQLAIHTERSPFFGAAEATLFFENAILHARGTNKQLAAAAILKLQNLPELQVEMESKPGSEKEAVSGKSFGANFVTVLVHPHTGQVKVQRVVSVIDAGRIINKKTAVSQVYGSVAWGLGIALMEEGIIDHRFGSYINNNLADYHLPVHADMPEIEVLFIDKPDPVLNPMGAKGLGEIGMVGFAAAVANAVYHATGKRVRHLPITADKLL